MSFHFFSIYCILNMALIFNITMMMVLHSFVVEQEGKGILDLRGLW